MKPTCKNCKIEQRKNIETGKVFECFNCGKLQFFEAPKQESTDAMPRVSKIEKQTLTLF